jgi:ubiquitin carboxyl-terminal hydrolase 9/24
MFNASDQSNHAKLLSTRLQNLRFVYGLNIDLDSLALDGPKIEMSCEQLVHLWNVCSDPIDREALMIFLANASKPDDGSYNQQNDGKFGSLRPENSMHNIQSLSPCFSDNLFVFEKLFCADVGGPAWEDLNEMAYQSFQSFDAKELRVSSLTTDALWKICLSAGNDVVASWAMNDLLAVYKNNSYGYPVEATRNGIETNEDNLFSQRIFRCLVQVKEGLRAENRSSERSAERCIRILSAAIDQCNSLGGSARALADRLTMFHLQHQKQANAPLPSVEEYLNLVPHGMRGVFSCDTVSIIARATSRGVGTSIGSSSSDITAGDEGPARYPSMQSERFLLEIHPLQSLASIKSQIALRCNHDEKMVKFINLTGHRRSVNSSNLEPRISALPDSTLAADLGIMEGSEIIALLSDKFVANNNTIGNNGNPNNTTVQFDFPDDSTREKRRNSPPASSHPNSLDLNGLFSRNGPDGSSNLFFDTLIAVLETLPVKAEANNKYNNNTLDGVSKVKNHKKGVDTHSLAWDLLLAMPTNTGIIAKVHKACSITSVAKVNPSGYEMAVEPIGDTSDWASLLDFRHFELSVYVMQILDSFLRPAPVMFSSLPGDFAAEIFQSMFDRAKVFRSRFIESGGFDAVLRLFITSGKSGDKNMGQRNKMGNEFALRIIQECFFGNNELSKEGRNAIVSFNEKTMSNFLNSLVSITIENCGVSDNAILRVLKLARLMLESGGPSVTTSFTSLPGNAAETFLTSILLWKGSGSLASASIRSAVNIRKCTEEMILAIPLLSASALPWLVKSLKSIDPFTDGSDEFFSVLLKLVSSVHRIENAAQLRELGTAVCIKIASCPRPNNETANIDHTTGVLCGCLKLLIALIEVNDGDNGGFLLEGSRHVMQSLSIRPWSDEFYPDNSWQRNQECMSDNDKALVDLMGSIFDGFISSARSSGLPPICCDKVSRQLAFNVISAAAQACDGGTGYCILSHKINIIIANVAPALRHRWGQNASVDDTNNTSRNTNSVRYSGLKNQGCTCYMNSVLQQLFMMPALRKNLCSAEVPSIVRSAGGGAIAKGGALVGKKISVHWENGNKYDAVVASYKEATGMHTINYCPIHFASGVGNHQQRQQLGFDISTLPRDLPEEYILTEGRPGKETGAFEIPNTRMAVNDGSLQESGKTSKSQEALSQIKETPDEASSRKLLEEVQRTFVNLDEARGRCYDPRALVEASHCLKLEFDVWQQNDASEFAMKMLDRLEISLKKWSPSHFKFLAHTFGMKKTTQKICRECGLKVRRTPLPHIVLFRVPQIISHSLWTPF